jgi:Helix-turn-helix domain
MGVGFRTWIQGVNVPPRPILIIAEVRVRDHGFSTAQQEELRGRWRSGESLGGIARGMGAQLQHVRRFLLQRGGLKSPPHCRSLRHLAGEEREEISRGIAAGKSARAIARDLGRPASTRSREIARNGSGRLRLDFPDDPAMWVSHKTIYLALFDPRRRAINRQLSRRLRTVRRMRLPRKARRPSGRGRIRDMLPLLNNDRNFIGRERCKRTP